MKGKGDGEWYLRKSQGVVAWEDWWSCRTSEYILAYWPLPNLLIYLVMLFSFFYLFISFFLCFFFSVILLPLTYQNSPSTKISGRLLQMLDNKTTSFACLEYLQFNQCFVFCFFGFFDFFNFFDFLTFWFFDFLIFWFFWVFDFFDFLIFDFYIGYTWSKMGL